ncbi:MAG: PDZ domain-containing protein [Deltaproteobacteria bacterium]
MLTGPAFGDENKSTGGPTGSVNSASTPASCCEHYSGEQAHGPAANESPRHRAALGVLLSASDDAVIIVGVIPGSPAERVGLRSGDEIRYVGDQRIRTISELTETIGGYQPGTRVDLLILRNGRRQIVEANLAAREATLGGHERPRGDDAGRSGGPAAGGGAPAPRGPGAGPAPSGPTSRQIRERQRVLSQRMLTLERQIYRLQQELNELRYSHNLNAHEAGDMQEWWERQHHGQADDDPALFQ